MLGQFIDWLQISSTLFNQSTNRIIWNLFLAFVPLIFSFYLFCTQAVRNIVWWFSLLIFIAFLPNAPYVLTDSIHIIELSRDYPVWAVILIVIPQYTLFILLGFEAYVISLSRVERYLPTPVYPYRIIVKAIAHGLSAIGVYIGRFERFNSWDFVTQPGTVVLTTVEDLFEIEKMTSMAIAFLVIWLLSESIARVNERIIKQGKIGSQT